MAWYNAFNWFKNQSETETKTKRKRTSPNKVDWTDSLQINSALTKGLYHNSYPGMKLGGALAYNPIAVPVSFMGYPIPSSDNDTLQDHLTAIAEKMVDRMKDIHIQCHREGTIWIWPKYSVKKGLIWEFIPDDSVSDIVRDLETGEIIRLEVREEITISVGNGKTVIVERTKIFTKTKYTVTYSGQVPSGLRNKTSRNPAGIIPIHFSNNADGDEVRGHSDYERIVTDLKDYHDTALSESEILAKFSPKMVQNVKDVEAWSINNGFASSAEMFTDIEIGKIDLIVNTGEEKTEFEYPERVTEGHRNKKQEIFHKIVETSGVPEIAWGLKTEGNNASAEESMTVLMNYVTDKRDQKNEGYKALFSASLILMNIARVLDETGDFKIKWNTLSAVSAKTKSEIFKNFTEGLSKVMNVAGMTKKMLYDLWVLNFPQSIEETFEEFEAALPSMIGHIVATKSSLEDYQINQGFTDPD